MRAGAATGVAFDDAMLLLRIASDSAQTQERLNALKAASAEFDGLQARSAELDAKERDLAQREQDLLNDRASLEDQKQRAGKAQADLETRSADLAATLDRHAAKSAELTAREAVVAQGEADLTAAREQFSRASTARQAQLDERESALNSQQQTLAGRYAKLKELVT